MASTEIELHSGGALAIASDQMTWTSQQIDVLRSVGVSEDVTPGELSLFLHECQRTGLDPFTRQIYLIGRKDRKANREVFRSQTGIDGYRVVAHRAARRDGVALSYADTLWCGPDEVWREVWIWEKPPLAAKVTVYRNDRPFPAVATFGEYAARWPDGNPKDMWARMPANQLAKCAEALALRKAFPQDLAGTYTAEEMEQAEARDQLAAPQPQHQVAEAVGRKEQADREQNPPATEAQRTKLILLMKEKLGITDRPKRIAAMSRHLGREITTFKDITTAEAHATIDALSKLDDHIADAETVPDPEPAPEMPAAPVPVPAEPQDGQDFHLPPSVGPEGICVDMESSIGACVDRAELEFVGQRITELADKHVLHEAHLKRLDAARRAKSAALTAEQPARNGWSHDRLVGAGLAP